MNDVRVLVRERSSQYQLAKVSIPTATSTGVRTVVEERGIVTCNALSAGPRTQRRITHQSLGNFSRGVTQKFHLTFGRAHNVSTHTVFRIGFGPIGDRTGSDGLGRTVLFVGQTVHTRHTVARHFRRRVNIVHLDGPTQTTDGIRSDAVPMSAGFLKIHKKRYTKKETQRG
jgi:hypothetical protein